MGRFSKVRESSVYGTGNYFEPGVYRVRIKNTKVIQSSKNENKEFFVIETEVLESSNDDIKPGTDRSHVIPLGETMSMPNVKAFIAAASGVDPLDEQINEKVEKYWSELIGEALDYEKICDQFAEENPIGDQEMDLECVEIITQGKKQPFTKHNWQPRAV